MQEWLHFLNHAHEELDDNVVRNQYTNPAIHKAFTALERLSQDEQTQRLAEMREKALKDQISALTEAKEEGRKEGMTPGELIGGIRLAQFQLELPLDTTDELAKRTIEDLRNVYHELQQRLPRHFDR